MPFSVYKLKFKIYAAHTNFADRALEGHYHTFLLTLYLKVEVKGFDAVKDLAATEKQIGQWLEAFKNKDLRETKLFREKDTSIETLGDVFFEELKRHFDLEDKLKLIRLDISENPVRSYSVSNKPMDKDVNEIPDYPDYVLMVKDHEGRAEIAEYKRRGSSKSESISIAEGYWDSDSQEMSSDLSGNPANIPVASIEQARAAAEIQEMSEADNGRVSQRRGKKRSSYSSPL